MAYLLAANFRTEGYDVRVGNDGAAGLKLALKYKPVLIISDVMLPMMDGHEMVRLIREKTKVPVLFLTAKNDEADRLRIQLAGDGYMMKPFSMGALTALVREMFRRAGSGAVAEQTSRKKKR
jgi:DNA-binding response OmpR family regulator